MAPLLSRLGVGGGHGFGFGKSAVSSGPSFSATGGTITTAAGKTIHTFTAPGTFVVSNAPPTFNVEYLVVAGGGRGGGGGGGGGGFRTNVPGSTSGGNSPAEPAFPVSPGSYSVIVGAGGTELSGAGSPKKGGDSTFATITSTGGGSSNSYPFSCDPVPAPGGSGAGAGHRNGGGCTLNGSPGTPGQGFGGAESPSQTPGGGGGAGQAATGQSGGNGLQSSITGTSVYYSGGGGGAFPSGSSSSNSSGLGGGGTNIGGGGIGGAFEIGGSGIVIIAYPS